MIIISLEHDFEKILAKGLKKGIVKAVEELIDNGSINEIAQIMICTMEQQIMKIIEITVISAIASGAIGNSLIPGVQKTIQDVINSSKKATLLQIQDVLIKLLKNKYGTLGSDNIEEKIKDIDDVDKLSTLIQNVVNYDTIEAFNSNITNI